MQVLSAAAASDPEIERMHNEAESARYADQRRLADVLFGRDQLREGLSPERAADAIWTLAGPGHIHRSRAPSRMGRGGL